MMRATKNTLLKPQNELNHYLQHLMRIVMIPVDSCVLTTRPSNILQTTQSPPQTPYPFCPHPTLNPQSLTTLTSMSYVMTMSMESLLPSSTCKRWWRKLRSICGMTRATKNTLSKPQNKSHHHLQELSQPWEYQKLNLQNPQWSQQTCSVSTYK